MPERPQYFARLPAAIARLGDPAAPASWVVGRGARRRRRPFSPPAGGGGETGDLAGLLGCSPRTALRVLKEARGNLLQVNSGWVIGKDTLAELLVGIYERYGGDGRARRLLEELMPPVDEEKVALPASREARRAVLSDKVELVGVGQVVDVAGPAVVVRASSLKELLLVVAAVHQEHAGGARQRSFEATLQGRSSS